MLITRIVRALALALTLAAGAPASAEQGSTVLPVTGPHTMAEYSAFLNDALLAMLSCNSGSSAPTNGVGGLATHYQCWADTSANPVVVKIYDGSSWVVVGKLNTSAHTWTPTRQGTDLGTASTASTGSSGHSVPFLDTANTWSATQTFPNNSLTLAQFPLISASRVLGSIGGGTPAELTATQLTTLINPCTPSLSGAVPAVGTATGKFLRDDCSWQPSGGSGLVIGSTGVSGGTTGRPLYDNGGVLGEYPFTPQTFGGTGADNSVNTIGDLLASQGTNGQFAKTSMLSLCLLNPSACTKAFGYTSIAWYGAKCDGIFQSNQNFDQPATNLSITSGQVRLTSSGSTFTAADVTVPPKRIYIPGAGPAGAALSTTISAFVSATQVDVATPASTTITTQAATNTSPFVYGSDDTTVIQAAITAAGNTRSTLYIPGSGTGCIIRQQGANAYALLQNKPFTIRGDGHFSNLMTFPDTPSTVDNLLIDPSAGWDWTGLSWTGFSIGNSPSFIPPTFLMYKRSGKRGLAIVDTPSANLVNFNLTNLMIGESGNDHSLYVGNPTSSASQGGYIANNKIFGGNHLHLVSDSFKVQNNWLYGASTFGGLYEFVSGAAGFNMSGNNITWAGCTVIESGTKPTVTYNYIEEVVNASSCARNAMLDFNGGVGTIFAPTNVGNVIGALVSTTATPVRYSNSSGGIFGDNTITTSTARTGVTSVSTLSCSAVSTWNSASPHFSTALASPNPFSC